MINYKDENGRELYTETTISLNNEVEEALAPIYAKYFDMGYKRHEIEYLMHRCVMMAALKHQHKF